jgi:hypothetical protein
MSMRRTTSASVIQRLTAPPLDLLLFARWALFSASAKDLIAP